MAIDKLHVKSNSRATITKKLNEIVAFLNHSTVTNYKGLSGNDIINKMNQIITRQKATGKTIEAYKGGYNTYAVTNKLNEIINACNN